MPDHLFSFAAWTAIVMGAEQASPEDIARPAVSLAADASAMVPGTLLPGGGWW